MNRFNLPDIQFVDPDPIKIEARMVGRIEKELGEKLAPADPRRMLIKAVVPKISQLKNDIDYSAKQNLLGYAADDSLDHLGKFVNTERESAKKALVTMRFHFSLPGRYIIEKGTRVTPNYELMYETIERVASENEEYVDIICECVTAGTVGNGYSVGQIDTLVDPLPFVESVTNITESYGGYDVEDDDRYASRIHLAPESFSTAGPTGAYKYHTMSAHTAIVDAYIDSPTPGHVVVYPLLENGGPPTEEILEAVRKNLSDEKKRPHTDYVTVEKPVIVSYDIDVTYWAASDFGAERHDEIKRAVDEYINWQSGALGRAIDPSELVHRMKQAGAKRVEVLQPIHRKLERNEIAKVEEINIRFGGYEYV